MIDYTQQEFQEKYEDIKELETVLTHPSSSPVAYILGGQPGAGKSSIQTELIDVDSNIIIINGDSYRQQHPHFELIQAQYGDDSPKYTQSFINAVIEKMINDLSTEKYNLIVEGTLRTAEVPLKTAKELKEKGYRTELCVMAVKPEISYESTILRYENAIASGETPRATSKAHHDMVVECIADNLDTIYESGIFDCIKIYTREEGCIYSSDDSILKPSEVEKGILYGEWSDYEKENLISIVERIRKMKQLRNAPDLKEYILHSDKIYHSLGADNQKYRIESDFEITPNGEAINSEYVRIMNMTSEKIQAIFKSGVDFQTVNIPDKGTAIIIKKDDVEKVKLALTPNTQNRTKGERK